MRASDLFQNVLQQQRLQSNRHTSKDPAKQLHSPTAHSRGYLARYVRLLHSVAFTLYSGAKLCVVNQPGRLDIDGLDLLERKWIEDTQLVFAIQEHNHLLHHVSVSQYLSVSLSVFWCVSVCFSVSQCRSMSLGVSRCLSVCLSVPQCLSVSLSQQQHQCHPPTCSPSHSSPLIVVSVSREPVRMKSIFPTTPAEAVVFWGSTSCHNCIVLSHAIANTCTCHTLSLCLVLCHQTNPD